MTTAPVALTGTEFMPLAGNSVKEMAENFEALFLGQLVKEMRQSLEPGSLFVGDSGDVQGGLFDLYLGRHLAEAGGIGLARYLQQQLNTDATATAARPLARR